MWNSTESFVRFMSMLSRILVVHGQVTPSIFGSICSWLGSQHSRSPHGQFLVNIRACTCMYAITRILPEFKSVSSSHVSRPLVRIAAAPGGLSRNRGADQVTRTTRVANATFTTFAPSSYEFTCCGEKSNKCNHCFSQSTEIQDLYLKDKRASQVKPSLSDDT